MTADEIRDNFFLSKQAMSNYLKLGVLTPVPGTEDNTPLYYADEVAVIREALTTCQSAITRLNSIRNKVQKEIDKANSALAVLQLDAATKGSVANSVVDSIALFMERALPKTTGRGFPLAMLRTPEKETVERAIRYIQSEAFFGTPHEFFDNLHKEVSTMDVAFLSNCIEENEALKEENKKLKEQIEELKHKIELMSDAPESRTYLASNGFCKELTEKQIEGLKQSILECGFTVRSMNCLKSVVGSDREFILANIVTFSMTDVKRFRNFGKNSLQEVVDKLAEYDLTFGMDIIEIEGKYYLK